MSATAGISISDAIRWYVSRTGKAETGPSIVTAEMQARFEKRQAERRAELAKAAKTLKSTRKA
jgi:hypothetical protein